MKNNFRLNLAQAKDLLCDSANEVTNPRISGVLQHMTGGIKQEGWLKAHADVTWEKS